MAVVVMDVDDRAIAEAYADKWWLFLISGAISLSHTHIHGWWMGLISGVISIALGAWAIGNPDRSVLLFVTIIGIWCIFKGVADLMASFSYKNMKKELAAS